MDVGESIVTLSNQIAKHVLENYVEPARKNGHGLIEVRAGEVHRALGWKNRVASVCTTLESQKFQRENHLFLCKTSGPASGRSTTVSFAYQILDPDKPTPKPQVNHKRGEKLMALYGLCAETFRDLGGGEEFLRREREWGPDTWEIYEQEQRDLQVAKAAK
jgi:hypothetical protein